MGDPIPANTGVDRHGRARTPHSRPLQPLAFPLVAFLLTLLLVLARESRHAGHLVLQPFNSHLLSQEHLLYYLFTLWVVATMLHPASLTTRLLELPPLRFVGRLSYSIYLWHVLFFFLASEEVTSPLLHVLGRRPWY